MNRELWYKTCGRRVNNTRIDLRLHDASYNANYLRPRDVYLLFYYV